MDNDKFSKINEELHTLRNKAQSALHGPNKQIDSAASWPALQIGMMLLDLLVFISSPFISHWLRFDTMVLTSLELRMAWTSAMVAIMAFGTVGTYRRRSLKRTSVQFKSLFYAGGSSLLIIFIIGFLSRSLDPLSRLWVFYTILFTIVMFCCNRIVLHYIIYKTNSSYSLQENLIIYGTGKNAFKVIEHLKQHPSSEINLLGVFDDRIDRAPASIEGHKVVGTVDSLLAFVRENRVDRVIITLPWTAENRIIELLRKFRTVPVRIDLCPDDVIWNFSAANVQRVGGIPLVTVANSNICSETRLIKHTEDVILGSIFTLLSLPLMFIIALLIRLESSGPAIFKQKRYGYNNKVFNVYKFRSMYTSQEGGTITQAKRNDPRVTRVGRFLRRTSLDELPQFFNVLKGEMSIVGPRPHAVQHNILYSGIISEYFARHNVKPGITGWAQVNGLRGETETIEKMTKRVEYDLYYVENWSLSFDIKIICLTIVTLWFQKTAY